ncbi:MAG: SDR family oxidoreductase [Acidimicrobiales bacterium]|nr:SDR family oxidoreductase [Hyphomonadaceae bacterium]RZV40841.1 MAG: SDR family oxidoreductase [Acidimicrobiales bacterium]
MVGRVKLQSENSRICVLLGCGYTARAIAPSLRSDGFEVLGTTRNPDNFSEMAAKGVHPLLYQGKITDELRRILSRTTHIISSIPPSQSGDPFISSMQSQFGKNWSKLLPNIEWAGYLSATSVYGDRQGKWVFEEELLHPSTNRGKARVIAELDWVESGLPVHIFRIAGIYGPARSAFDRIRSGKAKAVIKKGHISNRIHVHDIATAIAASINAPAPHAIYNLADDDPCPPQDVLQFAATLLRERAVREVPFDEADLSDMARSFYREARRTSNARIKRDLDWYPQYPSYREGLVSILEGEENA